MLWSKPHLPALWAPPDVEARTTKKRILWLETSTNASRVVNSFQNVGVQRLSLPPAVDAVGRQQDPLTAGGATWSLSCPGDANS